MKCFRFEQILSRGTCTLVRMIEMCSSLGRTTRFATTFSLAAVLLTASTTSAQVPPLGSAQTFAVLAGAAVTCTASAVTGNVGVAPGGAIVGCTPAPPGMVDPAAAMAYENFVTAYTALGASCVGTPLGGNLAGLTLLPGTYCVTAASTTTNGTLTLRGPANGIWIFKIGTGGGGALTGTNFSVVMTGGGQPCNVVLVGQGRRDADDFDDQGNHSRGCGHHVHRFNT